MGSTPDHSRAAVASSPSKETALAWLTSRIRWEVRLDALRSTHAAELSHSPTTESMRTYTIVVEPEQDGGYIVGVPALRGCFARGRTIEECQEHAVAAIELHIDSLRAHGDPVPEEVGAPRLLDVMVTA
jgi:predicted RNase H-like HicB family nuclease